VTAYAILGLAGAVLAGVAVILLLASLGLRSRAVQTWGAAFMAPGALLCFGWDHAQGDRPGMAADAALALLAFILIWRGGRAREP
jgi:hypothetical protein